LLLLRLLTHLLTCAHDLQDNFPKNNCRRQEAFIIFQGARILQRNAAFMRQFGSTRGVRRASRLPPFSQTSLTFGHISSAAQNHTPKTGKP
jgi:hypothetical protein